MMGWKVVIYWVFFFSIEIVAKFKNSQKLMSGFIGFVILQEKKILIFLRFKKFLKGGTLF